VPHLNDCRDCISPTRVMIDYATEANIKAYRKPLGILNKAILKTVREPLTFWISSEPPVKNKVAGVMDASLSRSEHFPASAYRSVTYVSERKDPVRDPMGVAILGDESSKPH
jgi:hypothetical protein